MNDPVANLAQQLQAIEQHLKDIDMALRISGVTKLRLDYCGVTKLPVYVSSLTKLCAFLADIQNVTAEARSSLMTLEGIPGEHLAAQAVNENTRKARTLSAML